MRFQNVQGYSSMVYMVWLYLVLQMMLTYQVHAQSGNDSYAKGNVHYVQNIGLGKKIYTLISLQETTRKKISFFFKVLIFVYFW